MLWRYAAQFITTVFFDAVGGELKLKAYGARIRISFLVICLRTACDAPDPSQQSEELKLCTLMMTQLSNWSLDLEMCPIDLSQEQGDRLYDTGMEYLLQCQHVLFKWFQIHFVDVYTWHCGVELSCLSKGSARPTRRCTSTFFSVGSCDTRCALRCTCLASVSHKHVLWWTLLSWTHWLLKIPSQSSCVHGRCLPYWSSKAFMGILREQREFLENCRVLDWWWLFCFTTILF
jgi:hypothetical protein